MESGPFTTVLGHSRILDGVAGTSRQVMAYDGDAVIGVAGYEPLYGHHGEAAIAVTPGATGALGSFLLDGLVELATVSGLTLLRFGFATARQRAYSLKIISGRNACSLRPDRLEVRTGLGSGPAAGRADVAAR